MLVVTLSAYALGFALALRTMLRSKWPRPYQSAVVWPIYAVVMLVIGCVILYLTFDEAMRRRGI